MRLQHAFTQHKSAILYAVLVVFCLISMAVSSASADVRPGRILARIFVGIQEGVYHVGDFFARTVSSVRELGEVREQYAALLDRLEAYEEAQSDLEALRRENEALRDALGFHRELATSNVPARVIAKEPGNLFSTISIDRGRRDGIRADQPVIAMVDGNSGLVGKVVEVFPSTALILPILDPSVYVAARLQESRYEGLVNGNGMRTAALVMRYVDRQARFSAKTGDRVVTSGLRSLYPTDIPLGTVTSIQGRPYESSLEIQIEPIVDFSRLEYVFVLIPGDSE